MIGQVGIGSTSPKGALDITSTTMGIVFPVVALVDANTETVVNPNGPNIVPGTTVYNTTVLDDGVDSLYPGIFFWNGTKWQSQREKKDNALFIQDTDVRTGSSDIINPVLGKQTIPFDSNTFTPIYTGKYALHLMVHFGAGNLNSTSSPQFVNFAKQEGEFEFIFNGNTYTIDLSSYSVYNNDSLFNGGSLRESTNIFNQIGYDYVETLTAGTPYTFSLTFNQADAPGFEGDGDIVIVPAGDGRGYVIVQDNIRCYLEINYVYE
jgi:hypothetical protein